MLTSKTVHLYNHTSNSHTSSNRKFLLVELWLILSSSKCGGSCRSHMYMYATEVTVYLKMRWGTAQVPSSVQMNHYSASTVLLTTVRCITLWNMTFIIQLFMNAYCPRFMEYWFRSKFQGLLSTLQGPWRQGWGNLPEFTGSTSQVRAQVTFKSQAKFESRSNFYISRFFLIFMSSGCCSLYYNDVLVVNGK